MKVVVLSIVAAVITLAPLNAEVMQPVDIPEEGVLTDMIPVIREPVQRNVPEYAFDVEPLTIMASWYDYFPGSYESIPIRVQPSPAGMWDGGGIYIAFQAIPSAGFKRNVYFIYILDGEIINMGSSFPEFQVKGFPGIDINPNTGNPFLSWHTVNPADPDFYQCPLTFDQYSHLGSPGLWNTPYGVLNNPYTVDGIDEQEFIWPSVFVGPSPNAGQKRIYVIGKNFAPNPNGFPCENYMIAFADYTDHSELALYEPDMWTYVTIPQMNDWRNMDVRPFSAPIVSRDTGIIAFAGNTRQLDSDEPYPVNNVLFVLENDNYGEGDWTLYTGDPTIPVQPPPGWWPPPYPHEDMRYGPYVNRHNAVIDDQGNYHFVALYTLTNEENTWFPYFSTTKHVKFDRNSEEFIVTDLYPRNEDGSFYLPWPDNWPSPDEVKYSYPCYWYYPFDIFSENYHRIIEDGPRMVALFQESTKAYMFHQSNDDEYADWANAPETHIMVSADYGESWEDPIILNSLETPELAGMIPAYWYMADHIEHLYDHWYRIHLFFYSQNDYGSYIQDNSPNTGGDLMYTSLDIKFPAAGVDDEAVISEHANILKKNYPNPFNPETVIEFSLARASEISLTIYNTKGQKVRSLLNEHRAVGDHQVIWDGRDERGRNMPSGVYLYRLVTGEEALTRKMMILK